MRERQAVVAVALCGGVSGLLVIALLASGCGPAARHAVLSRLVDGYPPPEEQARLESMATVEDEREAEDANRHDRRPRVKHVSFFLHDPFESEECDSCHTDAVGASSPGSQPASHTASRSAKVATGEGFLRTAVTALCFECHDDFLPEQAPPGEQWLHGPAASGWCVTCHDPHKSRNAALLRYAPGARLCLQCHERSELAESAEVHLPRTPEEAYTLAAPRRRRSNRAVEKAEEERQSLAPVVKDCTRCHDPHRGRDHFLLREQVAATIGTNDVVAPLALEEDGSAR